MSVSIQNSLGDKFRAKLSQLSPTLIVQVGWILGAFAIVIHMQTPQLATLKHQSKNMDKDVLAREEAQIKARLSIAKVLPTFGYKNTIANWYFLDFVQYFGDTKVRQKAGYGATLDYFDTILDLDPRFLYGYYYLSSTGSLYAGEPERTVDLMNRGLKSLSPKVPERSYYIWRLKGVDELIFLGDVTAARNSMQTAANWAREYTDPQSLTAAQVSQATANFLARNPNSKQARFDAWSMVLSTAIDDLAIERAIAEIRATGGKVTISPTGEYNVVPPAKD
ncbi:hypothetical protein [Chamaesiphon polymorphus]|uniref:Uncharacterized protein n=1 Tax=Chamaesiphon polymorphus CCALA 037 TaxID=2107692 RepID=A0A2T1GHJ1_9CYAN|nr:hypothetical protein [Chamaesiphon polymorphus]PSB57166.1 hypothetical protein C7B77_09285 [Chamaesiphon polymorphus CCALA 037]